MRVVFAAKPHLPTPGGAQYTTHWLALELARRGHEVTVVADQPRHSPAAARCDTRWGYTTHNSEDAPAELSRRLLAEPADCVVVGGYGSRTHALTRAFLTAAAGAPTLLYLHDLAALAHLEGPGAAAIPPVRVAAVSRFLAAEVESRGLRCPVVPPIVERGDYRVSTSRRAALFVNPIPVKGVEIALALARARPDVPFAFTRCWWIPAERLAALRSAVAALPNVELRDAVQRPEDLYGDARVLLAPSRYPEAWGRVVSEAQASGIPAIASDAGGLPEAVGDGGIVVRSAAGVEVWARALDEMWEDEAAYARWSARAAEQSRSERLSGARIADRFEALVREVAGTAVTRPPA